VNQAGLDVSDAPAEARPITTGTVNHAAFAPPNAIGKVVGRAFLGEWLSLGGSQGACRAVCRSSWCGRRPSRRANMVSVGRAVR
jgi:hypothetical protein